MLVHRRTTADSGRTGRAAAHATRQVRAVRMDAVVSRAAQGATTPSSGAPNCWAPTVSGLSSATDCTSTWACAAVAESRDSPRSLSKESATSIPPPRTTAEIGVGSLVRRRALVAANIANDHSDTDFAKGTVARFHGW